MLLTWDWNQAIVCLDRYVRGLGMCFVQASLMRLADGRLHKGGGAQ